MKCEYTGIQYSLVVRAKELKLLKIGAVEVSRCLQEQVAALNAQPSSDVLDKKSDINVIRLNGFSEDHPGMLQLFPIRQGDKKNSVLRVKGLWDETNAGVMPEIKTVLTLKSDDAATIESEKALEVFIAGDLRNAGMKISRKLSYERTVHDVVLALNTDDRFGFKKMVHVLIMFDLEGALYVRRKDGRLKATLFYDSQSIEGDFKASRSGEMPCVWDCLSAFLSARVFKDGLKGLSLGIKEGLAAARRFQEVGFGADVENTQLPGPQRFENLVGDIDAFSEVEVPITDDPIHPVSDTWRIMDSLPGVTLERIAIGVVEKGLKTLKNLPQASFRNLVTVDRDEIESFRAIQNRIIEYLNNPKQKRPLNLAVFGPPGSGKSFGVTEVAESIKPGLVKKLEFNLSQYTDSGELVGIFHRVRDEVLNGFMPLVFFDEFDSELNGELGWLKYFLAPMQDGMFKDGESMHPIGRAIFVFAGGTRSRFRDFAREEAQKDSPEARIFQGAKGPDFVSRLNGYVNVLGPNPMDASDRFYILRRALLFRSFLVRKTPFVGVDEKARVEKALIMGFLQAPVFKHGARSMESIIDMSNIASGTNVFNASILPSPSQLELHVPATAFQELLEKNVVLHAWFERIAQASHEVYCAEQSRLGKKDLPALKPWDQLEETYRVSNRDQAEDYPRKLELVGCGFLPKTASAQVKVVAQFAPAEVEVLSMDEHERFVKERIRQGWTYGTTKDTEKLKHPCLVPWEDLSEEERDKDRVAVRSIPAIMEKAGFVIYRAQ